MENSLAPQPEMQEQENEFTFDVKSSVQAWYDATTDWRAEMQIARAYYDGEQYTAEQKAIYKQRRQPIVVYNRTARKIDAMVGHEQRMRTDPVALPRTPKHERDAEACTDALRFVLDKNRFDAVKSQTFEDGLVEGVGACEVCLVRNGEEYDVVIKHVDPWHLIWDARSIKHSFEDATWLGVAKWLDLSVVLETYPDSREIVMAAMNAGKSEGNILQGSDALTDRPDEQWIDNKRKRVQVAEIYAKQGLQWFRIVAVAGAVVVKEPSYYVDADGKSVCPIRAWSPFVERNDLRIVRYGMVRSLIGPQDEINMRRSRMLHMLHQRRIKVQQGGVEDIEALRIEMSRPDGVILEMIPGAVQEISHSEEIAGNAALLADAKAEIDQSGPNAAIQGKGPGSASGRAIIAQQQAGMAEMQPLYDRLREWELSVYRDIWDRIRQAWTGPKWIRVTDNAEVPKFMLLNQPMTVAEEIMELAELKGIPPEQVMQELGITPDDPRLPMQAKVNRQVAQMDVDIVLATKPDMAVLEGEQFELLAQILPAISQMPPAMARLLIEASNLRNKQKLLKVLEEQSQGPDPMQQAMMQLDIAERDARVKKTLAEAARAESQARVVQMPPPGFGRSGTTLIGR